VQRCARQRVVPVWCVQRRGAQREVAGARIFSQRYAACRFCVLCLIRAVLPPAVTARKGATPAAVAMPHAERSARIRRYYGCLRRRQPTVQRTRWRRYHCQRVALSPYVCRVATTAANISLRSPSDAHYHAHQPTRSTVHVTNATPRQPAPFYGCHAVVRCYRPTRSPRSCSSAAAQ